MKILILIVAVVLLWLLSPVFIIYALFKFLFRIGQLSEYCYWLAFAIDQMGNVMGAPIMNDVLLKKEATHKYGNPDETISHVTGVNYLSKMLTSGGYFVAHCLNTAEKNHVEKAAETDQRN